MLQLILASIGFIPWVIYIIVTYYSKNFSAIDHIESATGFGWYLAGIGFIYLIYKLISLLNNEKKVIFTFWHIIGYAFLQLLVVTIAYTSVQVTTGSPFFVTGWASSVVLFSHILSLLVYPIFLAFLWRATGYSILRWIAWWEMIPLRIRIGAEIAIGLGLFSSGLLGLGFFHMFTLNGLLSLCAVLLILAFPGWKAIYQDIRSKSIEFNQHDNKSESLIDFLNPRLVSAEIAFLIVSFLISVSLINAIRPMPIGWDDLGVYMNFPRIMANTGYILEWAGFYTWQLITGSGFLWNQIAANAFYVNQLGGILSMIIITSILSVILERKDHKYIISLPLLLAGIYYMMPMTVFQQAKDMKLDPALMMVSVSAFWVLWYTLREKFEKQKFFWFIGLAWIIVGIAFSMKLTTLILVISSLALIAYRILGIYGFLGFFFLFLGIFTGGNLWVKMNVWMPIENIELIRNIAIVCGSIGLICLGISLWENGQKACKTWFFANIVFILGLVIGLSPWFIKNWYEAKTFTTNQKWGVIDSLLSGYAWIGYDNYSAIYSKEEYSKKRKEQQSSSITSDGKSQNEDFSRYFGQESGLNNYLKLPANLTFQKNQSGEFTEITYIFFALLPSLLLFVRGREYKNIPWTKWIFATLVAIGMILMAFYYFIGTTGIKISAVMGEITLPLGYAFIIWGILSVILISHLFIADTHKWNDIKSIIVMLMVYGFLFLISAFGIVWYGVFVYFLFLVLIGLASLSFVAYNENEENDDTLGVKIMLSILFFIFIFVYILRSAFPHGWNNLTSAGMNEYKYNKLNQNESIFTYRNDYVTPIATMNLVDPNTVVKRAWNLAKSVAVKKILTPERLETLSTTDLHQILLYFKTQIEGGKITQDKKNIEADIENIGNELYSHILSPKWDEANKKGIYRIGTFMTYLINENGKRYLEDSLVFEFETFFYNPSPEITIDRMKKVWLGYLLTDLNAATIDRDPRRVLTTRFEHLLLTMRAKNLKLVDTDNLCLQVALGEYALWKLQTDDSFIDIAGTNYESYRGPNLKVVYRNEKQSKCATYVINMINESAKNGTALPSYLIPIRDNLIKASWNNTEQQNIISRAFGQSYFALFEILDTPIISVKPPITEQWSGTINTGSILSGSIQ
jgi:hypothetical protein